MAGALPFCLITYLINEWFAVTRFSIYFFMVSKVTSVLHLPIIFSFLSLISVLFVIDLLELAGLDYSSYFAVSLSYTC